MTGRDIPILHHVSGRVAALSARLRPPATLNSVAAARSSAQPATARLIACAARDIALDDPTALLEEGRCGCWLVPELPRWGTRGTNPALASRLVWTLKQATHVTVAVPAYASERDGRRWNALAVSSEAEVTVLGSRGWDRVDFSGVAGPLQEAYVPAELRQAEQLVVLLRREPARAPFDYWLTLAHPHTALRASSGPERDRAIAQLARCATATYVIDLDLPSRTLAAIAVTRDPIAAELLILAAGRIAGLSAEVEDSGPWEHPRIQAAVELGAGVRAGFDLILDVRGEDRRGAHLATAIADQLDCRVEDATER